MRRKSRMLGGKPKPPRRPRRRLPRSWRHRRRSLPRPVRNPKRLRPRLQQRRRKKLRRLRRFPLARANLRPRSCHLRKPLTTQVPARSNPRKHPQSTLTNNLPPGAPRAATRSLNRLQSSRLRNQRSLPRRRSRRHPLSRRPRPRQKPVRRPTRPRRLAPRRSLRPRRRARCRRWARSRQTRWPSSRTPTPMMVSRRRRSAPAQSRAALSQRLTPILTAGNGRNPLPALPRRSSGGRATPRTTTTSSAPAR
mmetsp:Transcript_11043/g.34162  ORF Transcript_11043/g.34162 Transcript_11043/m.34162 type:complete len:251 (+) Transcript_11043:1581-2333(+)